MDGGQEEEGGWAERGKRERIHTRYQLQRRPLQCSTTGSAR